MIQSRKLIYVEGEKTMRFEDITVFGELAQMGNDTAEHTFHTEEIQPAKCDTLEELLVDRAKVYRGKDLFTIGMPCGGIAAGHVMVRGDGTLARFYSGYPNNSEEITTHWTWGPENHRRKAQFPYGYRTVRPEANIKQGFVVTCMSEGDYRPLQLPLSEEGFSDIGFCGEYPVATICYEQARQVGFPLKIQAEVFSPFIPNDLKNSANPCTIYRFKVKNNSEKKVSVQIGGYLENAIQNDVNPAMHGERIHTVYESEGISGVLMTTKEKESQMSEEDIAFDKDSNSCGEMSISVLGDETYAAGVMLRYDDEIDTSEYALIRNLSYNLTEKKKLGLEEYKSHIAARPCGYAATTLNLESMEEKEITFVLSWYFPNFNNAYVNYIGNVSRMYTNWYSSAKDVCEFIGKNIEMLYEKTMRFRNTYYQSSLPLWFIRRCIQSTSTLATHPLEWWKDGSIHSMEGVCFCFGAPSHVWQYIQSAAYLFPELEHNLRMKRDIGTCLRDSGRLNFREYMDNIVDDSDLQGGLEQWYYAADGQCGTILRFYREYINNYDENFLENAWDSIKLMISYLIYQDELDGTENGMISAPQHNTSDAFLVGENTYTGSAYLAVLRAGEEMAYKMKDPIAEKYKKLYESGRAYTIENLWNGEYFINTHKKEQEKEFSAIFYDNGCHIDQLHGQTWSFLLGLGYLYPEEMVKTAFRNLFKYNFTKDQKMILNSPKKRDALGSQADLGDAGLLTVTYPKEIKEGDSTPNYWYGDFTWSGFEYHAATGMIYAGLVEEGLSVYRGVDNRYQPSKHNPFNEIEGGDHYTRAMAAFGGLRAISGFVYHGEENAWKFAPKIQKDNFYSFFTTGTAYGVIKQRVIVSQYEEKQQAIQKNEIEVADGVTAIKSLEVQVPENMKVVSVSVNIDGKIVDIRNIKQNNEKITIQLEKEDIVLLLVAEIKLCDY